jgi:hypothetical protein
VFTAPGGIGAAFAFNLNFLPQFLTFNNVVPLTSLRISTQEDGVLHDLNAAGIAAFTGFMSLGALPANNVVIRIATGHIPNKNVTIQGVTSAAGAIAFFINSDNRAPNAVPLKSKIVQVLATTNTEFQKFTALFIPALAAVTDRVTVDYSAPMPGTVGHTQIFENQELQALSSYFQQVAGIIINNVNSYIHRVTVYTAAATPVYVLEAVL